VPALKLHILIATACGGAVGASCRYLISVFTAKYFHLAGIPLGTLIANVVGAFLMGVLMGLFQQHTEVDDFWRPLLVTGFLGALTTFSSFSFEVLQLLERGQIVHAASYVLVSAVLCVAMVWFGMQVV